MRAGANLDPRFELVDELGRGGMGIVYRARDRERGGEVALKALREVGASDLLRLKREFRVMCDVRHPNLVRLGELVERDGGWFFTMELVDGVEFLEWVGARRAAIDSSVVTTNRRGGDDVTRTSVKHLRVAPAAPPPPQLRPAPQFDEGRLRTALRGVTEGLAGLHREGLVHRDVKPSNIKIDHSGRVVLLDFGVTIPFADSGHEIAGTFAYMAPEQAHGEVTSATDWYSVGVMLFQVLTGCLPFPPTRAGLAAKADVPAPSPDAFVRDLPHDLVSLCRDLLAIDPARRATEAEVRAVVGLALPLRVPAPTPAPFVGRKREQERLASVRARQQAKQNCEVALILGPSGVGKTSLARRFLDEHVSALVLESRCDERETVPFNALDGIVDGLARVVSRHREGLPVTVRDALSSPSAAELRRLFPVLAELEAPSPSLSLEQSRATATRALREILGALGEAMPLVLFIDDAQWADADSGALLAELLSSPAPPLLVVITARGPEPPPLIAGLTVPIDELELGGLDTNDAIELATAVAAKAPIDAVAIVREAEGHPMFIAELSRFAAERRAGAGSLDEAVWARACDVSTTARRLLHVIVTDGGALPRQIAVSACGLAPGDAANAIDELRVARLIRAGDDVVEPYHDRVREALAHRLPSTERAALHLVLARSLQDSGAPPERLVHHWAGAGDNKQAAMYAEAAAARAADALAFERSADWLAMALRLGDHDGAHRRELLLARADALTHAGRPRDAGLAFLEASRTGDPSEIEQRDLRRRAAERLLSGGYLEEGIDVARSLLAEVGLSWPVSRRAAIRALVWTDFRIGISRLRWRRRAEEDLSIEQKLRLDTCWSTAVALSMADSMRGLGFCLRTLTMTLSAGESRRIACALGGAAFAAGSMNQERRFRRLLNAIERAVAETDAPEAHCYVALAHAARAYFSANDWQATRDISQRGIKMWTAAGRGHTWEVDLFEQFIGWALGTSGDYRAAADHAERVLRVARRRGDRFIEVGFRVQFPQRYLLDDCPDDGVRDVNDAFASWQVPGELEPITNAFYWTWRTRVMFSLYAGRIEADADVIEEGARQIQAGLLWHIPVVRFDVAVWSGACSLTRAAEAKRSGRGNVRAHLAAARRRMKLVAKSPLPARHGLLASFRAVIAHIEGDDEKAIDALRAALADFESYKSIGPAMGARWQLGRLVGGDEGAKLIETARAWLRDIDAVNPERMAAVAMPGFG